MLTVTSFHGILLKLTSTPPETISTKLITSLVLVVIKRITTLAFIVIGLQMLMATQFPGVPLKQTSIRLEN